MGLYIFVDFMYIKMSGPGLEPGTSENLGPRNLKILGMEFLL